MFKTSVERAKRRGVGDKIKKVLMRIGLISFSLLAIMVTDTAFRKFSVVV